MCPQNHLAKSRRQGAAARAARRGAASVEFAFTVPLFAVILLGICEMGRAVNASTQLTASIREAGRLACTDFSDLIPTGMTANDKIVRDIRAFLTTAGLPGDDVTISITHADGGSEGQYFDLDGSDSYLELFRIDASVPYSSISLVPLAFMEANPISASIVFRRGRVNMSQ